MQKITCLLILTSFLLSGCLGTAHSPLRLSHMTPGQLRAETSQDLCRAYDLLKDYDVKRELKRRNALTDQEWEFVDREYYQIGMSEVALTCAGARRMGATNVPKPK